MNKHEILSKGVSLLINIVILTIIGGIYALLIQTSIISVLSQLAMCITFYYLTIELVETVGEANDNWFDKHPIVAFIFVFFPIVVLKWLAPWTSLTILIFSYIYLIYGWVHFYVGYDYEN